MVQDGVMLSCERDDRSLRSNRRVCSERAYMLWRAMHVCVRTVWMVWSLGLVQPVRTLWSDMLVRDTIGLLVLTVCEEEPVYSNRSHCLEHTRIPSDTV